MKKMGLILLVMIAHSYSFAQRQDSVAVSTSLSPASVTEDQLENATAGNNDNATEDDSYLQELAGFQKNRVDLNIADEPVLKELLILTPLQIQNLLDYRSALGALINIYELQAVPTWNVRTIEKLLPYITIGHTIHVAATMHERFTRGEQSILVRLSQTLERSKGYLIDSTTANNFYPGSPQKLLTRYKYAYKGLLQYGLLGEKDAGEEFFRGSQKQGFDFYSAHLFIRDLGLIKSLALGDFTVNFGQGLTQWQSLAFTKGPDVLSIKRQATVLRPYNSAGEINFHRGIGITIGKNNWQATLFGSYRKMDANLNPDTTIAVDNYASSLETSGYHRTKSEVADKGSLKQFSVGANASIQWGKLHIGLNGIRYRFDHPLIKDPEPYNLYALNGKGAGNYSIDYSYTFQNLHFFGEAASSGQKGWALINGLLISVSYTVDMSFLYRNISRDYQSLYSNAFTESTSPVNEKGLFSGITIRPADEWQIDAYADVYKFPWLKYLVNAPSTGSDYFVQATYKPNKQLEIYARYKRESKEANYNPDETALSPIAYQPRQDWRIEFNYKINKEFSIRSRTEMLWFDKKATDAQNGYLLYADLFYKPRHSRFASNMRLLYFETGGYNSRLYAYEEDVLYYFSIPGLFNKGYRYYLNVNYDFTKKIAAWAKWTQTFYPGQTSIGTGLDEIKGNKKSAYTLSVLFTL